MVSLRTLGQMSYYTSDASDTAIPEQFSSSFYEGYGFGLALRYGNDEGKVTELIEKHISPPFKDKTLHGWKIGVKYFNDGEETPS